MISTPFSEDLVHGAAELEPTDRGVAVHRLPAWVRRQFPDAQLLTVEAQPAGVRVAFSTTATRIELVTHPRRVSYGGADGPRGRIDMIIDDVLHTRAELTGGDRIVVDYMTGASTTYAGDDHNMVVSDLPRGVKQVELWLPHNESLDLIELRTDASVEPVTRSRALWLHHGSSISHGSNALTPTETWPVVAARTAGVHLRNLGLGGSALVDPFLARVIRDAPADLISVKLGINVVNFDSMRLRSFVPAVHGFLDTIRDGHPDTPLLLVSPIFAGIQETTPGPVTVDLASLETEQVKMVATGARGDTAQGRLTLEVIRDALRSIAEQRSDDPHLHYLDGLALYGPDDAETVPLPDNLHPSAEAHRLIGHRFADLALAPGRPLAHAGFQGVAGATVGAVQER